MTSALKRQPFPVMTEVGLRVFTTECDLSKALEMALIAERSYGA